MQISTAGSLAGVALALATTTWAPLAVSQAFPAKPVRLVIPNAAGSATDLLARVMSQGMQKHFNQPFIVEPRPGGSAVIGTEYVGRQVAPDGYTLLVAANTILVFPLFTRDSRSDPVKDLVPVSELVQIPFALSAHASMPFSRFSEMLTYAKANPGKLNFATGGPQSSITLVLELIKQKGGVDMVNVPYQGSGQIFSALLANNVQITAGITAGQAAGAAKENKVKVLAVSGTQRVPFLPDVPSFGELGYPIPSASYRMLAPSATPRPLLNRLYTGVAATLESAEAKNALAKLQFNIVGSNPDAAAKAYVEEAASYAAIVKNASLGPR